MSPRNWQEWFVPPVENEPSEYQQMEDAAEAAGSRNRYEDDKLRFKSKERPRCVSCKRYMGYSSGMYIMIADPWRLHIHCFERVVEEKFKDGEVIDLSTGSIVELEPEAEE